MKGMGSLARGAVFVSVGAAVIAGVLLLPVCYLWERNTTVELLSGAEKAYLVVGLRTEGNAQTVGRTALCVLGGYFAPSACWAKTLRDDLLVFEITDDAVLSHRLENFGSTGGSYVFDGVLHYGRGGSGEDGPAEWRWHDGRFERLERETALAMRETYQFTSDLLEREGWKKQEHWLADSSGLGGRSAELILGDARITVTVDGYLNQGPTPESHPFQVRLLGHPSGDKTLVESVPTVRYFRFEEYSSLESLGRADSAAR